MTMLIDRLLREKNSELSGACLKDLHAAVKFDITNVARFYFEISPQDIWDIRADFPNIAPPYETFWMEFRMPERIRIGDHVEQFDTTLIHGYGALWRVEPLGDNLGWGAAVGIWVDLGKHVPMEMLGEARFIITHDGRWFTMDQHTVPYAFSPGPKLFRRSAHRLGLEWVPGQPVSEELQALVSEMGQNVFLNGVKPYLLALSFLHCKNVTVTEQRPPDWQQKVAQRKHDRPLVTYHVLNIEPMKTVLRTEGDIEHNGVKKALHICRGHFKTFTAEKPLFGRVTGTYWWQQQVRGSAELGVAVKDYNVRAPRQIGK